MSTTVAESSLRYPMMAYNFRVSIGSETVGFAEVSGLKREFETVTYRHGLSFREGEDLTKYYIAKYEEITLRRGLFRSTASLYSWLEEEGERSITIELCDENGKSVIEWRIAGAVLTKVEAPSFDAKSSDVAVESLSLMARTITIHDTTND